MRVFNANDGAATVPGIAAGECSTLAVDGKVTLEVKPRAITVAAQDASKTYGEDDPKFTYDVTSGELVEGESLQGIEIERDDDDSVRDGDCLNISLWAL